MSEVLSHNEQRRQAQRQRRGVLRVEEILQAANALFAEWGYDKVTMNMIAVHAHTSPGSLYQFFPHKEAVAQGFMALVAHDLHQMYDTMMMPDVLGLPFAEFLTAFFDRLMDLNRTFPGYLALEVGATLSPSLARMVGDVQHDVQKRLDGLIGNYWPHSTLEQRQLPLLVSYRVFLALLPLALKGDREQQHRVVQEMQRLMLGYWTPLLASGGTMSREAAPT